MHTVTVSDRTELGLDGAVVAVLGASGGLGRALCEVLARRGTRLLLAGRDAERLRDIGISGSEIVEVDIRDPSCGVRIAEAARQTFGGLDGLVNAAGVVAFGRLTDHDDDTIEELFLTNAMGPLWLLRGALPLLRERKGFFLQISGVVAEQPMAGASVYSATKAAVMGADLALARELRRVGVRVIDARPPHTETGLASRPLRGAAPSLARGLEPAVVAERIVRAIEAGDAEVPSSSFTTR